MTACQRGAIPKKGASSRVTRLLRFADASLKLRHVSPVFAGARLSESTSWALKSDPMGGRAALKCLDRQRTSQGASASVASVLGESSVPPAPRAPRNLSAWRRCPALNRVGHWQPMAGPGAAAGFLDRCLLCLRVPCVVRLGWRPAVFLSEALVSR